MTTSATVSERRPVTLDGIAAAALALLDEEGLSALTMRRLAAELHVEAPSLYHHVRGKEELLDLVAVHVMNGAPLLSSKARTPQDRIRDIVLAYRATMLAHPSVFALIMQLRIAPSGLLNSATAVLDELRACGLSVRRARERYVQCAAYINGWIAVEVNGAGAAHSTLDLPALDTRAFLAGLELLLP